MLSLGFDDASERRCFDEPRFAPPYPQFNGKLERYHRTLKQQGIRPKTPLSPEDAKRVAPEFIDYYNSTRLHSAIGYIAPHDCLANRHTEIFIARDKRLENASEHGT